MRVAFQWVNGFEPIAVTVWRGGHEVGARGEHETLDHLSFVLYRATIYMVSECLLFGGFVCPSLMWLRQCLNDNATPVIRASPWFSGPGA